MVRATWAPRGQTPVLRHKFNWKRMSMSAALCYRPDRSAAELVFATQPGAYHTETLIDFLGRLHAHLGRDAKITLLWDGLSSHRSRDMTAFIACCRGWLRVERLPAYAPELNPVEGLWGNVKGTELANRCPTPSTRRCRPRATDSTASPATPICASRCCATPVFPFDQNVTELCEPL